MQDSTQYFLEDGEICDSCGTPVFFYGLEAGEEIAVDIEKGKTLIVRYLTTGIAHPDGRRSVFFELNGQPRDLHVEAALACFDYDAAPEPVRGEG